MLVIAAVILGLTYAGIALTRLPRVNVDRPSAAFIGAVVMVLAGVLTFEAAVKAIDFNTIALLLGMMMVVSVLDREGFFTHVALRLLSVGSTPTRLMGMVIGATALLSAVMVNDTVVLLFTPVVVRSCRLLRVNPVPYLIGEAMASNIGSTATLVGNPQNMLIGVTSGISFGRFFLLMAPIAIAGCIALFGIIRLLYRRELHRSFSADPALLEQLRRERAETSPRIAWVLVPLVAAFFLSSVLDVSIAVIALAAGATVLLAGKARPSQVLAGVDWVLLLFFAGLFVVIDGARQAGVLDAILEQVRVRPDLGGIVSLHLTSTAASQLVSNVPLTMLVIPVVEGTPGNVLWTSLAAGATLGGNATLIGAVANIIVAEVASRDGVTVSFGEFLKVGMLVTAATIALSIGILALEWKLGVLN